MNVQDIMTQARDVLTVKRVFGEPYEKDGLTIIPAATLAGGGGGGRGDGTDSTGSGGGFGVGARPVGAYVIKDGAVRWHPALDLNRVILGGQIVGVIMLLTIRAIMTTRARAWRDVHTGPEVRT